MPPGNSFGNSPEDHVRQGQPANGPRNPRRPAQLKPLPPHHEPQAHVQRQKDALKKEEVEPRAHPLGPCGARVYQQIEAGREKQNSGQPAIHCIRAIDEQQAPGQHPQQKQHRAFERVPAIFNNVFLPVEQVARSHRFGVAQQRRVMQAAGVGKMQKPRSSHPHPEGHGERRRRGARFKNGGQWKHGRLCKVRHRLPAWSAKFPKAPQQGSVGKRLVPILHPERPFQGHSFAGHAHRYTEPIPRPPHVARMPLARPSGNITGISIERVRAPWPRCQVHRLPARVVKSRLSPDEPLCYRVDGRVANLKSPWAVERHHRLARGEGRYAFARGWRRPGWLRHGRNSTPQHQKTAPNRRKTL